ncbi:hypothetical protein [Sulfurisphaera ohwakuensis]|uniref:Uncharacterized protein n=1 Tax=Sulfurisphaera ohwakuensis TaxID=69656 RepID=A0A650CK83_SULOH|nr:hypothetical protein [Sulfurisphaera ohwakuensis]MBB5255104.1 hypothetical protein [Sulfurisphaera ohwakuensis]QGR18095.1 hypothetical protein D1869_13525 [Sulfurisphaera ohwakuensis]
MIRWELLLASISLTLISLSVVTLNNPTHIVINFGNSYELHISPLVTSDSITLTQNNSNIVSEIEIISGSNHFIVNISNIDPFVISLPPGSYTFELIKEINESNNKPTNIVYNVTLVLSIQKMRIVLHQKILYLSGIIGLIFSLVIYVIRKLIH